MVLLKVKITSKGQSDYLLEADIDKSENVSEYRTAFHLTALLDMCLMGEIPGWVVDTAIVRGDKMLKNVQGKESDVSATLAT